VNFRELLIDVVYVNRSTLSRLFTNILEVRWYFQSFALLWRGTVCKWKEQNFELFHGGWKWL